MFLNVSTAPKLLRKATLHDLEVLLSRQERRVQNAFRTFLNGAQNAFTIDQLVHLLQNGRVDEALKVVNSYIVQMGTVIPQVFQSVGSYEVEQLASTLGDVGSGVALTFDPTLRTASELMRINQLQFVQGFTQQQRDTTRLALANALDEGDSVYDSAQAFVDSIGLTPNQLGMVDSYEAALQSGSAAALDRALRDKRYDSLVDDAVSGDTPLTADQIDMMVGRYRDNLLNLRAETIARTEMQRTVNQARLESLNQVLDQAGFGRGSVVRVWHTAQDPRVRDAHAVMEGQQVGLDEQFEDGDGNQLMFPGDPNAPPETTINCRCFVTHEFSDEGDQTDQTDQTDTSGDNTDEEDMGDGEG